MDEITWADIILKKINDKQELDFEEVEFIIEESGWTLEDQEEILWDDEYKYKVRSIFILDNRHFAIEWVSCRNDINDYYNGEVIEVVPVEQLSIKWVKKICES